MGTLNMLGLAKRTKARFLITSTSGTAPRMLEGCLVSIMLFQRSTATLKFTHSPRTSKYYNVLS